MRRRRSRLFREDVLAPWVTLGVVVGLWWLGASLLGPGLVSSASSPVEIATPPRKMAAATRESDTEAPAPVARSSVSKEDSLSAVAASGEIEELREKRLAVPVAGIDASTLRSTFREARGAGRHHEAMDILAPRGTPVVASDDGKIAKLFTSAAGGLTIYQFDSHEQYCYYYAHLDSYAAGVTEGQSVKRGQTIGYVGTTGNAPPATPHLHFAIFKLNADKRWWEGAPIDPFLVLH